MTTEPDVWDAGRVLRYLRENVDLARWLDFRTAQVTDMSTGNLNTVFLAKDAAGREVFVKQAPQFVRVNPARKLSADRVLLEADALEYFQELDPGLPVRVLAVDAAAHAVVLESLTDHEDWRTALNRGRWTAGVAGQLGEFVGRTWASTHPLVISAQAHLDLIARFGNPELCALTDAVVFTEPFKPELRHRFRPALAEDVARLWADHDAMRSVAVARFRFATVRGTLLHGDLHSGSVMVPSFGQGPARIIDPEFAFVGPVGFDLGLVFGSLLTQAARAAARATPPSADTIRTESATDVTDAAARVADAAVELLEAFVTTAKVNAETRGLPSLLAEAEIIDAQLDAARMGSCEALRRLIHAAPVPDIEDLDDQQYRTAGRWLLNAGRVLLCDPDLVLDRNRLHALMTGATQ